MHTTTCNFLALKPHIAKLHIGIVYKYTDLEHDFI